MLLSVTECKHLSCSCAENWIFFNLLDLRKKLPIITVTFPPQCCASFQQITNKCDVLSCQYTLEDKVTWLIPQKSEKSGDHQSLYKSTWRGRGNLYKVSRQSNSYLSRRFTRIYNLSTSRWRPEEKWGDHQSPKTSSSGDHMNDGTECQGHPSGPSWHHRL